MVKNCFVYCFVYWFIDFVRSNISGEISGWFFGSCWLWNYWDFLFSWWCSVDLFLLLNEWCRNYSNDE